MRATVEQGTQGRPTVRGSVCFKAFGSSCRLPMRYPIDDETSSDESMNHSETDDEEQQVQTLEELKMRHKSVTLPLEHPYRSRYA